MGRVESDLTEVAVLVHIVSTVSGNPAEIESISVSKTKLRDQEEASVSLPCKFASIITVGTQV